MIKILDESFVDAFQNKTGVSSYDEFFDKKDAEYRKFNKASVGRVVKMTADEYIQACADKVFHKSVDKVLRGLDQSNIDKYAQMMKDGTKFYMPYLNLHPYFGEAQEGRHRMLAMAKAFGDDAEGNVLVVEPYDPSDEEVMEYAKRRYKSDPQFGFDYIRSTLDHYLGKDDEKDTEEVEAEDLYVGDTFKVDDEWLYVDDLDYEDGQVIVSAINIKSDEDVEKYLDDSQKVLRKLE